MNQQILAAYKKHYGEWNENGRDYNMFASGWLEARDAERARCLAIVELFTKAGMREDVQRTALAILDEINAG